MLLPLLEEERGGDIHGAVPDTMYETMVMMGRFDLNAIRALELRLVMLNDDSALIFVIMAFYNVMVNWVQDILQVEPDWCPFLRHIIGHENVDLLAIYSDVAVAFMKVNHRLARDRMFCYMHVVLRHRIFFF